MLHASRDGRRGAGALTPSVSASQPGTRRLVTLSRHIMEKERLIPAATGEFSNLLTQICLAAKIIHREVTRAGLVDLIGAAGAGATNATGDVQQKLDMFAHDTIFRALDHTGQLCAVASEESENVMPVPDYHPRGKYVVNFDPLDGSSNIDVGVSIGTTFSILRRVTEEGAGTARDCMQTGRKQVCAGYVMYGSSTILVYSSGHGVHQFILDPSVGEFLLVQDDVRMPPRGRNYSVNEGHAPRWAEGVRRYIDWLKMDDDATGRPYSHRYIGTLVADFHRTLMKGGIFLYPADAKNPCGKLRYLYEASPLAFIAEQAGGAASDGARRILDIEPQALHERTPFVVGSIEDVREAEAFIAGTRVG